MLLGEVISGVAEVERPRLQGDRVAAPSQVADDELQLGEPRHQQRLEVIEVLLPLRERVADEDDAIALAKRKRDDTVGRGRLRTGRVRQLLLSACFDIVAPSATGGDGCCRAMRSTPAVMTTMAAASARFVRRGMGLLSNRVQVSVRGQTGRVNYELLSGPRRTRPPRRPPHMPSPGPTSLALV